MSDETTSSRDAIPSTIGRYQIAGVLGFGAMGAVYKAFDPLIKRQLAIKTIRLDIPRNSPQHRAFIERFYQEARISGTLSHPNIVTLFDIGEENGLPFLAMEFVDGKTIAAVLDEGTRFRPEKVIGLVSQVASALDYAHQRGVIHRDIKPSNLILHDADKVKVTDFGIAKLVDSEITHSGALLGTPSYMSPEQAMGEKLDGRSDIFSLGVCAFEMLSGHQPFPGANVTSILYKLVHVEPVEPPDLEMNGLVPHKWREVFNKVLAKKPANRYQTASEFVEDLEYCLGSWFAGLASGEPDETGLEPTVTVERPAIAAGAAYSELETLVQTPAVDVPPSPAPAPAAAPADEAGSLPTVRLEPPSPGQTPAAGNDVGATLVLGEPATARLAPPGAPVRPAGVPRGPVILAAAALLLAAAGIVGWALWQRSRPALPVAGALPAEVGASSPEPVPAPTLAPPTAGSIRVESEPPGARVRVNGEAKGQTPLDLAELPFGAYELRVEQRGYEPQVRSVTLDAASPQAEVRVALARPTPARGSADIVSTPAGASVRVDGRAAGRTPLAGFSLAPGTRRVELQLEGHEPWSGTVDVVAGQTGRVEVRLRPLAAPRADPTPEPVDTERVWAQSDVDTPPRKLSGDSPSYPRSGAPRLRSGERLSVTVRFVVSEAGEVQDVSVVESGGKVVDGIVIQAVKGWRYEPATKRGVKVRSQMLFKQTFLGG
jgi:serine/threonine-protein kinase